MSSTVQQRVESWMKMPGFTPLNRAGSPASPTEDTADTIEVRLPPSSHDERGYQSTGASPLTAEPRTMPEMSAATRREREIWGTSPQDRPSYRPIATAYPNLENPVETSQKRKRTPSISEVSQQHRPTSQHQRRGSDLSRVLSATETAAAAIAVASAASGVSPVSAPPRERDAELPHASIEARDPYDLPRSRDYQSRAYGDDQVDHRREQQRREQHHDMWYSRSSREEHHPASAYDSAAYHRRSGSIQSPADEHSGNDSHQRERSAARGTASPQSEYAARSPDDEDRTAAYGAPYSPSQPRKGSSSLPQADPKRRKRNFSNRTKTGCLTCRKRKKKCDETKPECAQPHVSTTSRLHCIFIGNANHQTQAAIVFVAASFAQAILRKRASGESPTRPSSMCRSSPRIPTTFRLACLDPSDTRSSVLLLARTDARLSRRTEARLSASSRPRAGCFRQTTTGRPHQHCPAPSRAQTATTDSQLSRRIRLLRTSSRRPLAPRPQSRSWTEPPRSTSGFLHCMT